MKLVTKLHDKYKKSEEDYTKLYYFEKMVEAYNIVNEFVVLNTDDKEVIEKYWVRIMICTLEATRRDLSFTQEQYNRFKEVNINHQSMNIDNYVLSDKVLLHPKYVFINFITSFIQVHLHKYDVICWLQIGVTFNLDVLAILKQMLKDKGKSGKAC